MKEHVFYMTTDFWASCSYSERISDEKRINKFFKEFDERLKRLELTEKFNVTVHLLDDYPECIVKLGNIQKEATSRQVVFEDVTTGSYDLVVAASNYATRKLRVYCDPSHNSFDIGLVPIEESVDVTIELDKDYGTGVTVEFNGVALSSETRTYTVNGVKPGTYKIHAEAPHYKPRDLEVTVSKTSNKFTVHLDETGKSNVTIILAEDYDPVEISLGSKQAIKLEPKKYIIQELEYGDYNLIISSPGYDIYNEPVTIDTSSVVVEVELVVSLFEVTINFKEEYEDLVFLFNNVQKTVMDKKCIVSGVKPGKYNLSCTAKGYEYYNFDYFFDLEHKSFTIEMEALVWDVNINLDKVYDGILVCWDNNEIQPYTSSQLNYIVKDVKTGFYNLRITAPGYTGINEDKHVTTNSTVFDIHLKQASQITVTIRPQKAYPDLKVRFDEDYLDVTPDGTYIAENVIRGEHWVYASATGYENFSKPYYIDESGEISLNLIKKDDSAYVTFSPESYYSDELLATFDGEIIDPEYTPPGELPIYKIWTTLGKHKFIATAPGYEDSIMDLDIQESPKSYKFKMVKSDLFDATIIFPVFDETFNFWFDEVDHTSDVIDNKFVAHNVASGEHHIECTGRDYEEVDQKVSFTPEDNQYTLEMKKARSTVKIIPQSNYPDLLICFDGVEQSPISKGVYEIEEVEIGEHTIYASAKGYFQYYDSFFVDRSIKEYSFNMSKRKDSVLLYLVKEYPNVQIEWDNRIVPPTSEPLIYVIENVREGRYNLKVTAQGYIGINETKEVTYTQNIFDIDLKPSELVDATIILVGEYPYPKLYFDGEEQTIIDNKCIIHDISKGKHNVKCTASGFRPCDKDFEFNLETSSYEITLERRPYRLTIIPNESYSDLLIKCDDEIVPVVMEGLYIQYVEKGEHAIFVTATGYEDYQDNVSVYDNTQRFTFSLKELVDVTIDLIEEHLDADVVWDDNEHISPSEKTNKYKIYNVIQKTHNLKINTPYYKDIDWDLEITSDHTYIEVNLEHIIINEVKIIFDEDYPNLKFWFDGEEKLVENKECTITYVPAGFRNVLCTADGYDLYDVDVEFTIIKWVYGVTLPMKKTHTINIAPVDEEGEFVTYPDLVVNFDGKSIPSYLDRVYIAEAVETGMHTITATATGYKDYIEPLFVNTSFSHTIKLTSIKEITVAIIPARDYPDLVVNFDGREVPSTPAGVYEITRVPVGGHTITATATGFDYYKDALFFTDSYDYNLEMKKSKHTVTLNLDQSYDGIIIKWNYIEQDPDEPSGLVYTILDVPTGNNTLEVYAPGYDSIIDTRYVSEGSTNFDIHLAPKGTVLDVTLNLTDNFENCSLNFDDIRVCLNENITHETRTKVVSKISPGIHVITIYALHYRPRTLYIIVDNENHVFDISLTPYSRADYYILLKEPYLNAKVEFDGEIIHSTPSLPTLYAVYNTSFGSHHIKASATDYEERNIDVEIKTDEKEFIYTIELDPNLFEVTVYFEKDYPKLEFWFDNEEKIVTDNKCIIPDVKAGGHIVTAFAENYFGIDESVDFNSVKKEYTVSLKENTVDLLITLNSVYPEFKLIFDDKTIEGTSPTEYEIDNVFAGKHTLVATAKGYKKCTREFILNQDGIREE